MAESNLSHLVTRVPPDWLDRMDAAARHDGFPSRAEWVRDLIRRRLAVGGARDGAVVEGGAVTYRWMTRPKPGSSSRANPVLRSDLDEAHYAARRQGLEVVDLPFALHYAAHEPCPDCHQVKLHEIDDGAPYGEGDLYCHACGTRTDRSVWDKRQRDALDARMKKLNALRSVRTGFIDEIPTGNLTRRETADLLRRGRGDA